MLFIRTLLQLSWYALSPVFLLCTPQALYIAKTTLRLPEAQGNPIIQHGAQTNTLKFVHFGESTVAGVGVEQLQSGLSAQLCYEIQRQYSEFNDTGIECYITGQNGIRFTQLNQLIEQSDYVADFSIITMGVNDTTSLTSINRWKNDIRRCIAQLNRDAQKKPIFFTQVPPMAQFPALPAPIKYLLGLRAYLLNVELQRLCQQHENCHYVGSKLLVEKKMMAKDGYHPSELGYQAWAQQITPQILQHLRR